MATGTSSNTRKVYVRWWGLTTHILGTAGRLEWKDFCLSWFVKFFRLWLYKWICDTGCTTLEIFCSERKEWSECCPSITTWSTGVCMFVHVYGGESSCVYLQNMEHWKLSLRVRTWFASKQGTKLPFFYNLSRSHMLNLRMHIRM